MSYPVVQALATCFAECWVQGVGFPVEGSFFRVQGSGFWVPGLGVSGIKS